METAEQFRDWQHQRSAHNAAIAANDFRTDDPDQLEAKFKAVALETVRTVNRLAGGTDEVCVLDDDPSGKLDPFAFNALLIFQCIEESAYGVLKAARDERKPLA